MSILIVIAILAVFGIPLTLKNLIVGREVLPMLAKLVAGIILVGIFFLMALR